MIEHSLDDNCPSYIWYILYATWTSILYFGGSKLFWSRVYIKVWRVIEVCKAGRMEEWGGQNCPCYFVQCPKSLFSPNMNGKQQEHSNTLHLKTSISSSRNHLTISICIVVFSVFAFVRSNHCKDRDIEGDEALDQRWDLFRLVVAEIFPWLRGFLSINNV